jgi:predicted DNA-binding antitoxin AbrB/MazE fold protein
MGLEIEATYENGVLKLPRELPLEDGLKVKITIHPPGRGVKKGRGLIAWAGSHEDLEPLAINPEFGPEEGP